MNILMNEFHFCLWAKWIHSLKTIILWITTHSGFNCKLELFTQLLGLSKGVGCERPTASLYLTVEGSGGPHPELVFSTPYIWSWRVNVYNSWVTISRLIMLWLVGCIKVRDCLLFHGWKLKKILTRWRVYWSNILCLILENSTDFLRCASAVDGEWGKSHAILQSQVHRKNTLACQCKQVKIFGEKPSNEQWVVISA